ncbi:MAG: Uma2 family endonuclease [Pyrinomonadaceae bacterium]
MSEKNLSQTEKKHTVEEYLDIERNSGKKSEYQNGKVLATNNSNRTHNLIVSNITIAVGSRLSGNKAEIYVSNMRVQINANRFSYPSIVIVSGEPSFIDNRSDVLLNPTVAVEIYSTATSFHDKTEKLESYLAMGSIREYLLVKEDEMRVEHYTKQNAKQWIYRIYNDRDEVVSIDALNCKVSMTEIYAQIKFGQAEINSKTAA